MKIKKFLSLSTIFGLVALIAGCASPARVENMTAVGQPAQNTIETPLRKNLAIKEVTGGKETNPMWKSNIGSNEFQQALETSLRAVGLLADGQASRYMLTAHLVNVDQPLMGFDMTVTTSVSYIVTERSTGKEIFKKTLTLPYTATVSDAFVGVERLRLANEGAIRLNITKIIDELLSYKFDNIAINQ